jgi:hypothetical protein
LKSNPNTSSLSAQSAQRPASPAAAHLFFFNWPLPLSPLGLSLSAGPARPLGPADRTSMAPARLPPPIRKSVNFKNLLLLLLPPTIATRLRPLSASRCLARGALSSQLEDPFLPPLHRSSYPPSTQALMALIAIHCHRHYSGHSTTPPHRPSPSPSLNKRAPPPRSIPHLSRPSPALLPSSPLASIGTSTATRSMPLRAHLQPSSASPTSPPASPSSPTPPWLLMASFSAPKHRSGDSPVAPLPRHLRPPLPHPHLL